LFLLAGAAGAEVLSEGLVLDGAPADADAEAQPASGKEIDIGGLSCHEYGLALREDQDPRRELDSFGDGGQVGEHHERVVERVVLGVGAGDRRYAIGVHGAEDVVVGEEVIKAELLDRSSDPPYRVGVPAEFGLRVDGADLHGLGPFGWCAAVSAGGARRAGRPG